MEYYIKKIAYYRHDEIVCAEKVDDDLQHDLLGERLSIEDDGYPVVLMLQINRDDAPVTYDQLRVLTTPAKTWEKAERLARESIHSLQEFAEDSKHHGAKSYGSSGVPHWIIDIEMDMDLS